MLWQIASTRNAWQAGYNLAEKPAMVLPFDRCVRAGFPVGSYSPIDLR